MASVNATMKIMFALKLLMQFSFDCVTRSVVAVKD